MVKVATDVTCPRIKNVVPPVKLGQGYAWLVNFDLPAPASQGGWMIQEVHKWRRRDLYHSLNDEFHYWEAWEVPRGAFQPTLKQSTQNHFLSHGFTHKELAMIAPFPFFSHAANDMFADFIARPGSRGEVVVKALTKFYTDSLPPDFVVNHPKTQAGTLRSSLIRPNFWINAGMLRTVNYVWNNTVTPPKADLRTTTRIV